MLRALTIHNIVLIDRLEIDLAEGLSALTGETGAGKSILLDSLGLALGDRAESRLLRKGSTRAQVTACFDPPLNHPAWAILKTADIDYTPDDKLILRRTLDQDGKSSAFINDQPVSAKLLKQTGDTLVEIHGQFDTHHLLNPARHLGLLDDYAGLQDQIIQLRTIWQSWHAARKALLQAEKEAQEILAEEEYLRHVVEELITLAPEEGEDAALSTLKNTLQNRTQVIQALNNAEKFLGANGGADALIQKAYRIIGRTEDKIGAQAQDILEEMDRASSGLNNVRNLINTMFADMEDESYNFEDVDDRLYALRTAARKHECSVDALSAKREELEQKLAHLDAQDGILAALKRAQDEAKTTYETLARSIQTQRIKHAAILDKKVMKELAPLKLDKARFVTHIEEKPQESWNENGLDSVAFLIAANPGAEPGALNKMASGGERARFMLALKVVMAQTGSVGTLVFDEVDTGIGGAVSDAVGERLARLATTHQIMVVTHAPQVAARATHHWIVHKTNANNEVCTSMSLLTTEQKRREEIARMLSGAKVTEEARAAADKLLEKAA